MIWITCPLRLAIRYFLKGNHCACKNNNEWSQFPALMTIGFSKNAAGHYELGLLSIALGEDSRAGLCSSCVNALNRLRFNGTIQVFQYRGESVPVGMRGTCNGSVGSDSGFRDDPNTLCVQFLWLFFPVVASALVPCSTWDSPPQVRRWWVLPEALDRLIHQDNLCVRRSQKVKLFCFLTRGCRSLFVYLHPHWFGVSVVNVECHPIHATQSISTRAPFGSAATWTQARAGLTPSPKISA